MTVSDAIVYVVDDDESVRGAMTRLFRSAGFTVRTFETATDFLEIPRGSSPSCLLLDLRMPGMSGMELQQELIERNADIPIVVMTGHGDVPSAVRAMKHGALDFLAKPVDNDLLLETVRRAIDGNARKLVEESDVRAFQQRVKSLTNREHEIMLLVITGMLNKQIALRLGITETTVKVHRGRVMEKTAVDSLAELVRLCERAGFTPTADQ